jgi:hypothetical protein
MPQERVNSWEIAQYLEANGRTSQSVLETAFVIGSDLRPAYRAANTAITLGYVTRKYDNGLYWFDVTERGKTAAARGRARQS